MSPLILLLLVVSSLLPFPIHISEQDSVSSDPQRAAAAFEEGQSAHERGDLQSALRAYGVAIQSDPSLFQAYYQRATAFISLRRVNEAEADLKKAIELQPGFARAHKMLGQILLDRGDVPGAKTELTRALEIDPRLKDVRVSQAGALLQTGDASGAAQTLQTAIEQGEGTGLAFTLLGVALERLSKADEAAAAFDRALELEPALAPAREGKARALERQGQFPKAIEHYSAAYRNQPSPELALKLAQLHVRAGQPVAAIQLYRDLSLKRPGDFTLKAELLRLMAENGQAAEANREMERMLATGQDNAELLSLAGDLAFKEQPERAAEYYQRALTVRPSDNRARVQLGAALLKATKYDQASVVLSEALTRDANDYAAHANFATALFKLKDYPRSANEFIWLIKAKPEVAASYYFLAISLDQLGDCAQALKAYQAFIQRASADKNQMEIDEATRRSNDLQRLIKEKKCRTAAKGKGK